MAMTEGSAAWREACRRIRALKDCHFVQRAFRPRPALRSREPEQGYYTVKPYHGRPYNQATWALVPEGWDHEHCCLCYQSIDAGDTYWGNRRDATTLCTRCFAAFRERIQRKARASRPPQRSGPRAAPRMRAP